MKIIEILTLLLFIIFSKTAMAQKDTLFFNEKGQKVNSFKECDYYGFLTPLDNGSYFYESFYTNGIIRYSVTYIDTINYGLEGKSNRWFKSGIQSQMIEYTNNVINGSYIKYWENGKKRRHDIYENGAFLSGLVWDENGNKLDYFPIKVNAQPKGGMDAFNDFLIKNLKYPKHARKKGIEGKVYLEFFVEKNGTISNLKVKKSVDILLDEEAMRVMKISPNWIPGKIEGESIKTLMILPIDFKLLD